MTTNGTTSIGSNYYPLFDANSAFMPKAPTGELGRNEFITLLVKQMENQNPLEPMKDEQFVAQLATFSSLEQLIDLNSRMELLASGQDQLINSQSLTLIGREIIADTQGRLRVTGNGADTVVAEFETAPAQARVEILDQSGKLLHSIEIENPVAGRNEIAWDGFVNGRKLDSGEYKFRVVASDGGKESVVNGYVAMTVDGINLSGGGIALVSGDRVIDFANVIEIRMPHNVARTSGGGAFTGTTQRF